MTRAAFVARFLEPCVLAVFLTVVAACGGGGDGTPPPPPPVQPVSLEIAGLPTVSLAPRQTAQLTATLTYSDGSTRDITTSANWTSSNTGVLTVSPSGVVLAVAAGQAEVVAVALGQSSRGTVRVVATTPRLALFVGNLGGSGNADGVGADARFVRPGGVATDNVGNVYVADSGNNTIRKITPEGIVSTLAGKAESCGSADGIGAEARFCNPQGIATDSFGNVYVADSGNDTIRKITQEGLVSTLAGTAKSQGSADGIGPDARFANPQGIATDRAGNVYVADRLNNAIRKITPAGSVSTLAGTAGTFGSADGIGAEARFNDPRGVATDSLGNVYVADTENGTIRKITPAGLVSTLAGTANTPGSADGIGAEARFHDPQSVATDNAGNVYVTDFSNSTIRKITPAGVVSTLAGTAGSRASTDGIGTEARFAAPTGIATDTFGNIYVTEAFWDWSAFLPYKNVDTVRKIDQAGRVSTLAGAASLWGIEDGIGSAARLWGPGGIAADSVGNAYVVDTWNNRIRKASAAGLVSLLAGSGAIGNADGDGATASFGICYDRSTPSHPFQKTCSGIGLATDDAGNVYLTDYHYHTVRKITPAGIVSTLAGLAGYPGSADGVGTQARFRSPTGVAVDRQGSAYVADGSNHTIRKISAEGVVSTLAGAAGSSGSADGIGAAARFNAPSGVAIDSFGNVFVADRGNHTIRKISPAGIVTTVAGTAGTTGSADGIGAEARFSYPQGVATDRLDNLYVADTGNHTIRKIDKAGVVITIVGVAGLKGFTPGALPGVLASPQGIVVSSTSLYITLYDGVAVVTNVP